MRIALVDAFLGGSHRAWADGYAASSSHDIVTIGLPAAFWKWRVQGGWVQLAEHVADAAERDGRFDVLVAASTTNLPALLGATRSFLHDVPVALYMHENQLTYPLSPLDREDLTYAMINWTSMTVADVVLFNSTFHHDAWFEALPGFLGRFPDQRHLSLVDAVRARSEVLEVGVDLAPFDQVPRVTRDRPLLLWNQRWEYDKGVDEFAAAVEAIADTEDFDLAIAGRRAVSPPESFNRLSDALGSRVVHFGEAQLDHYRALLRSADVVISTARQEFFGIAITEAVYAGAFPLLPNRLVYPERIPHEWHDRCLWDHPDDLVTKLRWALTHRREAREVADRLRPAMAASSWDVLAPRYDARFASLAEEGTRLTRPVQ